MLCRKLLFVLSLVLFSGQLLAQQLGTIKGTVKDAATKEAIIGANIVIDGTATGSSTDLDGNFSIKIAPGSYNLKISYVSYKPLLVENVVVEVGKVALINAFIEEDSRALSEVVVTAEKQTNTVVALVNEIKFAENVMVGISGDQIQRTQDRDAGQVVRRIAGVSVVDDRFIVVRGLGARYNTVMLNDILTPSSEVDVKSFSFDLIPSGVIDRITISKAGAADMAGEFAGGVIKIYTRNDPEENKTSFSLSTGIRANTTFQSVKRYQGSNTDWLGFDGGLRQLPADFPNRNTFVNAPMSQRTALANELPNIWLAQPYNVSPDLRMNFNTTRAFDTKKGWKIGNLTGISYSNTHQYALVQQDRFIFNGATQTNDLPEATYKDDLYSNNVRLGIIHNWTLRLNDRNKIEFRNLFNQMGTSETTIRDGRDFGIGLDFRNYAYRYEQRSIYSGQFSGKHTLNENSSLNWTAGFNYTNRREPDLRRFRTRRADGTENFEVIEAPTGGALFENARFYSNLNEIGATGAVNYERKIKLGKDESLITKLRAGAYVEQKSRTFEARWFSYVRASGLFDRSVLTQPFDRIFAPENVNGTTGWTFVEGTKPSDTYDAQNTLAAFYVSAAIPVTKKFNATIGLRGEYNRQQLQTRGIGGNRINVDNPILSPLPSLNLTYDITEKMLVRAAYSATINRPEFRELAPFLYYDFTNDFNFIGNPGLKISTVQNIDLRWELYPSETEQISVGAFYKSFKNPIEIAAEVTGGGSTRTYSFKNADAATNFGIEAEVRKSLYNLSSSKFIQDLTLVMNAALVKSDVRFSGDVALTQEDRPLAFQSPYLFNMGVFYNNEESRTQVNMLYNVIGPRINIVGNIQQFPSIYEMPRNVIDLSVTQGIGEHLEIKVGVQDLLNAPIRFLEDTNRDGKAVKGADLNFMNFRRGQYFTLGLTYKF
ncbi:TonB-dependent receptor [Rhodoflexus caldus]|uniref:TonB-dependent receptor n=1 Tax=Rhodoflexus caldus TaxID=2891236 RepID=UPI00202A370E|nr:TonB-dependent receptor [Rhodoflexus caldus]